MGPFLVIGCPLLLSAIVEFVLAAFLLRLNRKNSRAQRAVAAFAFFAALYTLVTALMYLLAGLGRDVTLLARMNWVGWFMIPAALRFVFFLGDENSRTGRIAGRVLYPFWSALLIISLTTDWIKLDHYTVIPYLDRDGFLAKPFRLAGVLQVCWLLFEVYRLRRRVSGHRRAKLNYFLLGLQIFSAGAIMVAGVLPVLRISGIEPGLGAWFSLPWVALTFYAMTRYRLFDLRRIVPRVAAIVVLSSLFGLAQLFLLRLLSPFFGQSLAIIVSLVLIGFAFFSASFRRIERLVRNTLGGQRHDYQRILRQANDAIVTKLDRVELLTYLARVLRESLGAERISLYLRELDGWHAQREFADTDPAGDNTCGQDDPLIRELERGPGALTGEEIDALPHASGRLLECLKKKELELVVPLLSGGRLQGVLALGSKGDGTDYTQSDIDLLEALAGRAVAAIENAELFAEVRRSQGRLHVSESRFTALAEIIPAAVFIHQGGKILHSNAVIEALTGYTREELATLDFSAVVHADYRALVRERAQQRLAGGSPEPQYEFKIVRKNGEERWVLMTAATTEYDGKSSVIGTLFDITERKALEGRLRYSQKMEAMGKLAGGVAHDFNNVLTAVVGYANLLHAKLRADEQLRPLVDQILAASERAASLTHTLLAFGKKQAVSLKPADLNGVVRGMEILMAGLVREGVQLQCRYGTEVLPVLADSSQLERVLMNLLVNARDAMPDGGSVIVETGAALLDAEFIRSRGYGRQGAFAVVSVSDTGTGMDDEIKARIFEPFFSTKDPEKGTGFGLSIAYDIVKEHAGYITVDSAPGTGSIFRVYLPLTDRKLAHTGPGAVAGGDTRAILVAENENDVRQVMAAVLRGHGYTVFEAADGHEAMDQFARANGLVKLAVLDMIMPKMTGLEVYEELARMRPGIKALFTSGYAEDVARQQGIPDRNRAFIEKPFSPSELVLRVKEMLDAPPAP
jgi:PAS domain S-box-containing protein